MWLLAVIKEPASIARYLASVGVLGGIGATELSLAGGDRTCRSPIGGAEAPGWLPATMRQGCALTAEPPSLNLLPGGQRLVWDAGSATTTNRPEANRLLGREYRKGWELTASRSECR
jgi:hypothetical protein